MSPVELLAIINASTRVIETATRLYGKAQAEQRELTVEEMAEIRESRKSAESEYERMLGGGS